MKFTEQSTIDTCDSIRKFVSANAVKLGVIATSAAAKEIDTVAVALAPLGTSQGAADRNIAGFRNQVKVLTHDIRYEHMQPIARFARARLRGVPNIAALTRSPVKLNGSALITAARAMATAGASHAQEFIDAGLPADTIDQLAGAADALEAAIKAAKETRNARVGTTEAIQQLVNDGRSAVQILHTVIAKQFAKDKPFLAEWNATRRVAVKPGAARGKMSVAGSIAPVTAGVSASSQAPTPAVAAA